MTEEIAAVPSADSAPYLGGGHVSDEEFDSWVKRSQDQADAVMADWDGSVEFERRELEPDPPPMNVEDEEIVDDAPPPSMWQSLAARIRAGEVVGPQARQEIAGEMMADPPVFPQWALEYLRAYYEPGRRVAMSMPRRQGRSAAAAWFQAGLELGSPLEYAHAEERDRRRRSREARQNLEAIGFVVVDAEAVPRSSGLVLPSDDAVAWARRTFAVPTQREIVPPDNVHLTPYSYFYLNGPVTFGQAQRRATVNAFPEW